MNEEINNISNETQATSSINPEVPVKKHGFGTLFWVFVLLVVGAGLAFFMYTVFKSTVSNYKEITTNATLQESSASSVNSSATAPESSAAVVAQDKNKPATQIDSEVIKQIDDLQKTDVTTSLDNSQVTDLQQ